MKKYPIIALAALAGFVFAACDEYTLPNPPSQSNPEEGLFNSDDLKLTSRVDGTIDLESLKQQQLPVSLFDVAVTGFPETYSLELVAEFCATEAFEAGKTVSYKMSIDENNVATIPVADVQQAYNDLVTHNPIVGDLYLRVPAYAVNGTSHVRLGGPDTYYYSGVITLNPTQPDIVLSTEYYLVGSFCNWDIKKGIRFNQVYEGNPYDNPEFTVKVDVTAEQAAGEGYQWKVVPLSGYNNASWEGALGAVGGSLVDAPEAQAEAGVISQEGPYMITINVMAMTYKVDMAFEYLWVPGFGSSVTDFNKIMRLTTKNYINYEGTMRLFNRFWFTGQASTKGVNYRPDGEDNPESDKGVLSGKMIYDPASSNTMKVPGAGGLYYIKANVVTLEWSATPIPSLQVIGGFKDCGWDTAKALEMTPNATKTQWTATATFAAGDEFKFCVDRKWDLSYGGAFDNIEQNGGNLKAEEAGTYELTLAFDVFPNTLTMVKK